MIGHHRLPATVRKLLAVSTKRAIAMAQVFSQRFTLLLRVALLGAFAAVVTSIVVYRINARADPPLNDDVDQPVPFSHQHHVRDDGIDCRYCHTSVETSSFAGVPPLATCMKCHSELFADAAPLEPLRQAYAGIARLQWNRVHALPDFVYFDHSIHVAKGIGCSTCHGNVARMPLIRRVASLYMEWCLECHRNPERYLRPREQVFNPEWRPPSDQLSRGAQLRNTYGLRTTRELTDCSTCHR